MDDQPHEPLIDYPGMIQNALRGVVRETLRQVAEEGLPGEHHFYIDFATREPGVEMPAWLLDRYPKTMRIVLQQQFWNLVVEDDHFAVDLRFGGAPVRLTIPYAAVTSFADPAVPIVLQFAAGVESETVQPDDAETVGPRAVPSEGGDDSEASADVVSIDRFRKR